MVLPLLKVGSLFVKSLAKPFSKQVKAVASKSPRFHDSMVWVARGFYKIDLYLTKISGDTTRKATQLNVNSAIDLGSEMASEFFLLAVAVGLLAYENNRSAEKEKKKEEALSSRFQSLEETIKQQNETIDQLKSMVGQMNNAGSIVLPAGASESHVASSNSNMSPKQMAFRIPEYDSILKVDKGHVVL
ncbi:hypothetical protein SAMD00019534_070010 [Acytostelium subglobosum LB1]|uniref:hypothetical protein n=1 Tax=Acytostelium subglobosum LB1 TaxID=1410327 RepID=UPI000644BDAB|nr:hypothetical protein SAMD00019534_070010 [Acytostelium subglobosum LB1]GAM23826.1 hypothetical protein SAMD00019534_070010 [Acytostelium subglobosum LB1]|eukprot:XP_012753567.1 hypothetical protein SAMD00019534_070010 [Acytostelium subglobosum LB1]